jgi:hypothetical protein
MSLSPGCGRIFEIGEFDMLFDVLFIKTVCDDTGHEHRACQAAFSVQASSLTDAVRKAEADFCRQKHVRDWTIFADAIELKSPTTQTVARAP